MATYRMTLKRMMMTALMMLIAVSAMADEQKIWLHVSDNGTAYVSLNGKTLELDKENKATVTDAAGQKVAVTVKPDNGYKVASVTAQLTTDAGNADTRGADDAGFLDVKKASDTEYTFEMPKDFNVSIYVTISKKESGSKFSSLPTITTDTDNPVYYLIQNVGIPAFSSFYAIPYTNDDETMISTANVPNSDMRFYFMSVENEAGFYFIIHCSGKYLYAMGDANADGGARLKVSASTPTDDRYKFSIEQEGDGYYIKNKHIEANSNKTAPLCKRGGNTGIGPDGSNTKKNFLKMNTYTPMDNFFLWNFIPISDDTPITWTVPFTLSTDESWYYYTIKNSVDVDYYISQNNSTVNTSNTVNNDIAWCFKEVPVGENGSGTYITYYYIIHALTGKYMCFDGDPTKYAQNQETPVSIQDKTAANEENCQFIVVKSSQKGASDLYNIIPKALKNYIWNNQSLDKKDKATTVRTATDRSGDKNRARWLFETTTFDVAWSDPVITCNLDGEITITNEEDNASFYYTIDGSTTPTKESSKYDASNKPKVNAGITTIMVRALGGPRQPSNVVTKTIVYNPTVTYTAESYTYTGSAQAPISSVDVDATHIDASDFIVTYKKNDAEDEFKDAGDYTIELTDAGVGDYIVYGSYSKSIAQVELTVTVDDQNITYGSAVPTYTISCTGFVNGESADNLTTAPTATCTYTTTSDVGTYDIVPSGGEATNYSFNYMNGTLTVGQLEAVLSWGNTSLAYDGNPLAPTVTVSNLVEGDECTVTIIIDGDNATETEGVKTAVEVGTYTATATALSNANYKLPTNEADRQCEFTIANDVFSINIEGWTYGGNPNTPVPSNNNGHEVTYVYKVKDAADVTYSGTPPTNAGNYTVKGTIAAQGEYPESVATADFTIDPKSLSTGTEPNTSPAEGITIDISRNDVGVYTITLKDGETELVEGTSGTEYDYSKNIDDTDSNFGIVTVAGANNYKNGFSTTYAKVTFTKPDGAGSGFAEAGLFDIPEGNSIGDLATPTGLDAYIVIGINDNKTVETEKLDYIPQGVPVLLLSDSEVENGFTVKPRNGGTDITDEQKTSNKLKKASGTDEQRHVNVATIYLLYRGEFVLNITGTLPEGKIYLEAGDSSSGTRSARLPIARGCSTGIKGIENNKKTEIQDDRWYSLDGRLLNEKPTKKGIYLREGKKVVIK